MSETPSVAPTASSEVAQVAATAPPTEQPMETSADQKAAKKKKRRKTDPKKVAQENVLYFLPLGFKIYVLITWNQLFVDYC